MTNPELERIADCGNDHGGHPGFHPNCWQCSTRLEAVIKAWELWTQQLTDYLEKKGAKHG